MVDQIADLFRTTHKVKTQQVIKSRGQHCGDIELAGYLANAVGPVPLVLDLHIVHDHFGSSSDTVSFMPSIVSTSGRLHSEFVRLLFLQAHRETDRFFAVSGVQLGQTDRGQFHFRRTAFLSQFKSRIVLSLAQAAALRITLNLDGAPITSKSHTHPLHSQTSRLLISSLSLGVPVSPSNPVYARRVDSSALVFSLSSHRHSYRSCLWLSLYRFIINKLHIMI
jgi:hypothetical protein